MRPTFEQILILARVPNLPTVWSNVLMAWVLGGGGCGLGLGAAVAGGTLLYAGGCTLNDACDARWDRAHKPERLIPCGALRERLVWALGGAEMAAGLAFFLLAGPEVWWWPVGLVLAILLYDVWHKETPWSVVVMGACRGLLVLSGAAVAGGRLSGAVVAAAGGVWMYIIALSLLARRESRPGGGLLRTLRPGWSVGRWVGEMLAAIPLVDVGLLVALGGVGLVSRGLAGGAALVSLMLWPLCRLLQRKYAAT